MAHSQGRHSLPHDEADDEEENIGMDRHCSLFRMMINDYFDGADADYGDNSADVDDKYFPTGSFSKPSKDHLTHLGGKETFLHFILY